MIPDDIDKLTKLYLEIKEQQKLFVALGELIDNFMLEEKEIYAKIMREYLQQTQSLNNIETVYGDFAKKTEPTLF